VNVERLIEQVEGKPAPVPLLAVQAFANTLDVETSTDLLESPDAFADWLRDSGLATPRLRVTPAQLEGARTLREAVRALLAAHERGTSDRKAAKTVGELAASHRIPLSADASGRLEPDLSPVESAEALIPQLLAIVFQAQMLGTWERLKLCENPECLWAFYDSSKNRSGSWCRMGLCGNRLKNRAYRERRRRAARDATRRA
jgi:predicted RNA-binding Zn ribbon-like protein